MIEWKNDADVVYNRRAHLIIKRDSENKMSQCNIRFAEYSDIDSIMKYIDEYWKKGHILATNRELFEWQYIHYGKVTMILAEDENKRIQGILGFIPYDETDKTDIALALWKANHSESFLGIRLLLFLKKQVPHKNIICPGINMRTTSKIYSSMGMDVGTMTQWYRLNDRNTYTIGIINKKEIPSVNIDEVHFLHRIRNIDDISYEYDFDSNVITPKKSKSYFQHRYFNHPMYQYLVYAVCDAQKVTKGFLVLRIQECVGSKVFRFVDFIGDPKLLEKITHQIDAQMKQYNVEYIDIYETGIDDDLLYSAGWTKVKDSGNIIPNYFAPFEQSIVDIHFCSSDAKAVIFRGDGDQDRPN